MSALISVAFQVVRDGTLPPGILWVVLAFYLAAIGATVWRVRVLKRTGGRMSVVQREFLSVLWSAMGMALVGQFAGFRLFSGWAQAAIWTVASGTVLFYIALHGNRRAVASGIVLIVSLIAANTWSAYAGFILGGGVALGLGGFGLSELLVGN